jgi:hypothetical protein
MRETATALTQFTPSRLGVGDALRQFVDRGAEVGMIGVALPVDGGYTARWSRQRQRYNQPARRTKGTDGPHPHRRLGPRASAEMRQSLGMHPDPAVG